MDTFFEKIVPIKKTPLQFALQLSVAIFSAAVMFVLFVFIISHAMAELTMFLAVGVAALGYGAWRIITSFNVEYEYSLTNGYLDVDKIIAQRKRKRVLATRIKDLEAFGRYDAAKLENRRFETRVMAGNRGAENLWFAEMNTEKTGHTLLVFEPDDRILEAIKKDLPRIVASAAFPKE